ncbi:ABC transporter ATP-binding protein [Cryobacterium sp. Y82]|uniref:ABC transporter ATP-binding protein n=1 Tax=Cryobacterium sp. Y82 TaxID=2045017 RepID=UPI0018ECDF83|nr:ABC transporter ATP-binding protein [Cryobacterium sp. Y82]
MLKVDGAHAGYGEGPDVLGDVSIEVNAGEVVALVGLNGAGKSTVVKIVGGLLPTRQGTVTFLDNDITQLKADERVRRGLALVPEGRQLFSSMTVAETLRLGTVPLLRADRKRQAAGAYEKVFSLFPRLADRRAQSAGTLSGGEQQMLAIARALMSSPRLLVLDEPSLGLAPQLVDQIFTVLRGLNNNGLAILLIEQNATIALEVSSRAYELTLGRASASIASSEMRASGVMPQIAAANDSVSSEMSAPVPGDASIRRPGLPEYSGVPSLVRGGDRP